MSLRTTALRVRLMGAGTALRLGPPSFQPALLLCMPEHLDDGSALILREVRMPHVEQQQYSVVIGAIPHLVLVARTK